MSTLFPAVAATDLRTSSRAEAWRSEWDRDLRELMRHAEEAESSLSYLSPFGTAERKQQKQKARQGEGEGEGEGAEGKKTRRQTGSYYTPADAAVFFWEQFFAIVGVAAGGRDAITEFWRNHHFIEPAAGAGVLVFALFRKAVAMGLPYEGLRATEMTIVDISPAAISFVREKLAGLAKKWDLPLPGIHYRAADFNEFDLAVAPRQPMFFGNPPFVKNPPGSLWKNSFADFLERALRHCGTAGKLHFILPVSIAFSRDYSYLRSQLRRSGNNVALSNFDNIPDTLFSSGKPESANTNKANSQRCTILTVHPAGEARIVSTRMHRWSRGSRAALLSSSPQYHDVTAYSFDDQFPRPESAAVLRYLTAAGKHLPFRSLTTRHGRHTLTVATVARNFIGLREAPSAGTQQFQFRTEREFHSAILILSSDLFLEYWRTVGDGFHVTRGNIMGFPLRPSLLAIVERHLPKGQAMWARRHDHAKIKGHPRGVTVSYDFSSVALRLQPYSDLLD